MNETEPVNEKRTSVCRLDVYLPVVRYGARAPGPAPGSLVVSAGWLQPFCPELLSVVTLEQSDIIGDIAARQKIEVFILKENNSC